MSVAYSTTELYVFKEKQQKANAYENSDYAELPDNSGAPRSSGVADLGNGGD